MTYDGKSRRLLDIVGSHYLAAASIRHSDVLQLSDPDFVPPLLIFVTECPKGIRICDKVTSVLIDLHKIDMLSALEVSVTGCINVSFTK